jgi:N-acetylglutamate synthase-like GNAT family acetyltransferase
MSRDDATPAVRVRRTADVAGARALALAAGLEVSDDETRPLALWGAYAGGRLVGVVSLDEDGGLPVIGWIAVAESQRGRGVGRLLLGTVEEEARRRGLGALWATARAPGFFLGNGYRQAETGEERELLLAGCRACPQLGSACRPQAVCKSLAAQDA